MRIKNKRYLNQKGISYLVSVCREDVIVYIENPKDYTKNQNYETNSVKFQDKKSMYKSVVFPYTNSVL